MLRRITGQSRRMSGMAKEKTISVATAHLANVKSIGEISPDAIFPATELPPQNRVVRVSRR
jgi:hypothetical protein